MRFVMAVAAFGVIFAVAKEASAITLDVPVTAAFIKENPGKFSIDAKKGDDGLIHFTVTRYLSEPKYLVGHFEVRDGEAAILAKCDFPAFVREKSVKYYFSVSPQHLAGTRFHLGEHGFNTTKEGEPPLPWVGGTEYQIRLSDFLPLDK